MVVATLPVPVEEAPTPALKEVDKSTPSARAQVRAWCKEQIMAATEANKSTELPALAEQAATHFSRNPKVAQAFLREMFRPIVYAVAQAVASETRQGHPDMQVALAGDRVVTRKQLEDKAAVWAKKWGAFLERVGDQQVPLLTMTKEQLLQAARTRLEQARPHTVYARLWESLAKDLKAGQTVRQRFSVIEVERRYQVIAQEVQA